MKLNRGRLIFGLLIIAAGLALWMALSWPRPSLPGAPAEVDPIRSPVAVQVGAPVGVPPAASLPDRSPLRERASWERFQERYGKALKGEFSREGRLLSVRGAPGGSAPPGYSADDPGQVIQRTKAVLGDAAELLGLESRSPVEVTASKVNGSSAQVYFQQTFDGLPVLPYGKVVVDLGPAGELVGIDSDYIPALTASTLGGLAVEEAVRRARSALPPELRERKIEGGQRILWVPEPGAAQPAFEFLIAGRQLVVDARDGRILFLKDRREH
ncbi:MAG: hypothetical protein NDJ90_08070 [Oligoflexia bacterium]|nr:hypothetical protein [Oligoflexia bacterium]